MPSGVYKRTKWHIRKQKEGFKKVGGAWNKGKIGFGAGEKNYAWKGERVGYSALHGWIIRKFGIADKCENKDCIYPRKNKSGKWVRKVKRYEWANISGEYKRTKKDFIQLCPSCHRKYDLKIKNILK